MLFKFSERLYEDLNSALGALRLEEKQVIKRLEQSLLLCIKYFTRLRDFFKEHPPKDKGDIIRFFKEVKPRFKGLLIYHQDLLRIESNRTIGDQTALKDYYIEEVRILMQYFNDHQDFYRYIRSGSTYLDEQYYLPGVFNIHLGPDENMVDGDTEFCASHDTQMARVIAHELLAAHLEKTIIRLSDQQDSDLYTFIEEEMMVWTQTKLALSELVYGIKETNALNHGKPSIARIAAYLEKVFHADIGNISDNWNNICGRANKTIFFDVMKDKVLERMDKKLRKK